MFFKQGHTYIGGASVPFIVSDSMIVSGAMDLGFDSVQLFDRDEFPIAKLPSVPPGTDDDWDTVAIGRRAAPSGDVVVPPGVRWVVDMTPDAPVATPPVAQPPAQAPPSTGTPAGWTTAGPGRTIPSGPSTPINVPTGLAMPLLIGAGVIGGAFFAYQAIQHFAVEGITAKEKKGILYGAAVILAWWGGSQLFELDKEWWFTVEGMAKKGEEIDPMTKKKKSFSMSIEDVIGLGNVYRLDEDLTGPKTSHAHRPMKWKWGDVSSIHWSQIHPLHKWDKPTQDDVIVPKYLEGSDYSGGSVTKSNHKVFIEEFGQIHGVIDLHGSHGSYGVAIAIGALMDDSGAADEMIETLTKLEDYPVIDEEAMSELETEEEEEAWESWARSDFTRALIKKYPRLEDTIDDLSSGSLYDIFYKASDRAGEYWSHSEGEGPSIRIERVVNKVDGDDIENAAEIDRETGGLRVAESDDDGDGDDDDDEDDDAED